MLSLVYELESGNEIKEIGDSVMAANDLDLYTPKTCQLLTTHRTTHPPNCIKLCQPVQELECGNKINKMAASDLDL